MNIKIKQFAEQAGFDVYGWNEKEFEKFAELIVKECVGCIDDGRGEASSMAEHGWRQVCQKEIKKHFGVE